MDLPFDICDLPCFQEALLLSLGLMALKLDFKDILH